MVVSELEFHICTLPLDGAVQGPVLVLGKGHVGVSGARGAPAAFGGFLVNLTEVAFRPEVSDFLLSFVF